MIAGLRRLLVLSSFSNSSVEGYGASSTGLGFYFSAVEDLGLSLISSSTDGVLTGLGALYLQLFSLKSV